MYAHTHSDTHTCNAQCIASHSNVQCLVHITHKTIKYVCMAQWCNYLQWMWSSHCIKHRVLLQTNVSYVIFITVEIRQYSEVKLTHKLIIFLQYNSHSVALVIHIMYSINHSSSFLSILKTFLYKYIVLENECVDINISCMQVTSPFLSAIAGTNSLITHSCCKSVLQHYPHHNDSSSWAVLIVFKCIEIQITTIIIIVIFFC